MSGGEEPIYRDLMRFKPEGLSPNAWAVKAGVSRTVWSDIRRHGNPSRRTLEKLLTAADSSLAEFEALRVGAEPRAVHATHPNSRVGDDRFGWTLKALPPLPLISSRLAGEWGDPSDTVELTEIDPSQILQRLQRPTSLAQDADAFALTIVGRSMWPRFRPGTKIAVSPRAPVAIGDDVLVRLGNVEPQAPWRVLITNLVRRSAAGFELRQFNPDRTVEVDADAVEAVLKIAGELI
jgi:SOS-response transcriptional repressor LexA